MSKTTIILLVFGVLIVLYLSLLLWSVVRQQRKMEAFAEKLEENGKEKEKQHSENFVEQQLERNLTIINAFEEMYDRKITREELKELNEILANEKVLGASLVKKTLETYKKDKEASHAKTVKAKSDKELVAEHFVELAEISSRLSNFVQKVKQHGNTIGAKKTETEEKPTEVEAFVQGNEPYTHLNKYMPLF